MTKLQITLERHPSMRVTWKVWRGITEPYELLGEGEAYSWFAATNEAATFIVDAADRGEI